MRSVASGFQPADSTIGKLLQQRYYRIEIAIFLLIAFEIVVSLIEFLR